MSTWCLLGTSQATSQPHTVAKTKLAVDTLYEHKLCQSKAVIRICGIDKPDQYIQDMFRRQSSHTPFLQFVVYNPPNTFCTPHTI